jgi:hypothetical protein
MNNEQEKLPANDKARGILARNVRPAIPLNHDGTRPTALSEPGKWFPGEAQRARCGLELDRSELHFSDVLSP